MNITNILRQTILMACCLGLFASGMEAKITLPSFFTSNMVLQQKAEVLLHGQASPSKKVTVKVGWENDHTYVTRADKTGNWELKIQTPAAGGPYALTFSDGKKLTLDNVLIGEVWFCSGQSNMEMPLEGWGKINNYQQEIADANYPSIRLLQVKRTPAATPQQEAIIDFGWKECSPEAIPTFSATAYFFARKLWQELKIPVGLIHSSWGGSPAESWVSYEGLSQVNTYKERVEELKKQTVDNKKFYPAALYNGMVEPFIQFPVKGAIWYQGEANANRATEYVDLFQALINDWRDKWKNPDMPFYYVQLAPFMKAVEVEPAAEWGFLREAQSDALHLAHTGMAVITDIGDAKDIHPKNKQEVGKRLALIALSQTYGCAIEATAPRYDSYQVEENHVRLHFSHIGNGFRTDTQLKGFIIAGTDHVFYPAEASIEGNDIIVSSPKVKYPAAVRYAWANNPICNLFSAAGLPVSPFRTDRWK